MILFLLFDGALVAAFILTYLLVTRRRARIYVLIDHLALLARRSLPLHAGLRTLGRDLGGLLGVRLDRLARRLEEGASFEEALAGEPRALPPLLGMFFVLGEKSGSMASFLQEARVSYRRVAEAPGQSVYYLLYPLFLSLFLNVCLTTFFAIIVPKFSEVALQIRASIWHGGWLEWLVIANQAVLFLCLAIAFLVLAGAGSLHFGTGILLRGKRLLDRIVLRVPLLGGLVREGSLHAYSTGAGLFLRAGASLPEALRAAAEAERNIVLRDRYGRIAAAVQEGVRFSKALRDGRLPDEFAWFVETGEASGDLAGHLLEAGTHYTTRARHKAGLAWRTMVPFFVTLNGSIVAGACLVVFLWLEGIMKGILPW